MPGRVLSTEYSVLPLAAARPPALGQDLGQPVDRPQAVTRHLVEWGPGLLLEFRLDHVRPRLGHLVPPLADDLVGVVQFAAAGIDFHDGASGAAGACGASTGMTSV